MLAHLIKKILLVISASFLFAVSAYAATSNTSNDQTSSKEIHHTKRQTHAHNKTHHSGTVKKTLHNHSRLNTKSVHHAASAPHAINTTHKTVNTAHHAVHATAKHHGLHTKHSIHHHASSHHAAHGEYAANEYSVIPHTIAITPSELASYEKYPTDVKKLVLESMQLAKQNLDYHFGSDNPKNKGMDCSGTVSYILKKLHIYDVPRDSADIYEWVKRKGEFHFVNNHDFGSMDFSKIKPGDLLFWEDTYRSHRSNPITHVMIYLGKNQYQEPLMFGANSGRHAHEKIWGVSVFNMLPYIAGRHFVGYGCIPDVNCR